MGISGQSRLAHLRFLGDSWHHAIQTLRAERSEERRGAGEVSATVLATGTEAQVVTPPRQRPSAVPLWDTSSRQKEICPGLPAAQSNGG